MWRNLPETVSFRGSGATVGISRQGVPTENAPEAMDRTGRLPRRVFNAPRNDSGWGSWVRLSVLPVFQ